MLLGSALGVFEGIEMTPKIRRNFKDSLGYPKSWDHHPVEGKNVTLGGSKFTISRHSCCKDTSYKDVSCKLTRSEGLTRL